MNSTSQSANQPFRPMPSYSASGLSRLIEETQSRPLFRSGSSRDVRIAADGTLVSTFKDNVFSQAAGGPVQVPGTAVERVKIYQLLNAHITSAGLKSTALAFHGRHVVHAPVDVAEEIEVVVKTRMIGSPNHLYPGISAKPTRFGDHLTRGAPHRPYVRFDWRASAGQDDMPLPTALADYFIDSRSARRTAYSAFQQLSDLFLLCHLHLIDACFYLSRCGEFLCVEISPDNLGNLVYRGPDEAVASVVNTRDKSRYKDKYGMIRELLEKRNAKDH